jgi:hypothetical protein
MAITIEVSFSMEIDDAVRTRDALETLLYAHRPDADRVYNLLNFVLVMFDKAIATPILPAPVPATLQDAMDALAAEEARDPDGVRKKVLEAAALVVRAREMGAPLRC